MKLIAILFSNHMTMKIQDGHQIPTKISVILYNFLYIHVYCDILEQNHKILGQAISWYHFTSFLSDHLLIIVQDGCQISSKIPAVMCNVLHNQQWCDDFGVKSWWFWCKIEGFGVK